jgi:hypothetical protein
MWCCPPRRTVNFEVLHRAWAGSVCWRRSLVGVEPTTVPGSVRVPTLGLAARHSSDFAQADTVSELVDVEVSECARFVDSLGLPLLKAKKLLAALRGAAQPEVCAACAPTPPGPVRGMRQTCALGPVVS